MTCRKYKQPPCKCLAYPFPHRYGKRCLEVEDAEDCGDDLTEHDRIANILMDADSAEEINREARR